MDAQIIEHLAFGEYLARTELSRSQLWEMNRSPWHFMRQFSHPKEQTRDMLLGRAYHSLVLEPHLFEQKYAIDPTPPRPEGDGRNKEVRAARAAWGEQCLELLEPLKGKEILKREEFAMLTQMAYHLRGQAHFQAAMNFEPKIECTLIWKDTTSDIDCRARPDIWTQDSNLLLDIKTIEEATYHRIRTTISLFGYDLQDVMYSRAVEAITGELPHPMIFLFSEKHEPYQTVPYVIDDESRERAFEKYDELMGKVEECSLAGEWPRFPEGVQTVSVWRR